MIYTCTMNTAIDLYVALDHLTPDKVNRTHDEDYQPNGKGVNVSIMLKKMGIDNTALGFIGGFSGRYIADALQDLQITTDFIEVDGITRINVFVNADEEYKIVNQGPMIETGEVKQLLQKIQALTADDILIVSGSLPKGVPESVITEIAEICKKQHVNLVLDTSVNSVLDTLPYQPFLLKPNDEEIARWFNKEHNLTKNELLECGQRLLEKGAQHVIISRGERGALYLSKEVKLNANAPQGKVVNTACSGDSLLATFIAKQKQTDSIEESLAYAVATGASTAFSKGLSDLEDVPALRKQIKVTTL
ncbi:1-phosphofructokinase [Oceanobacillus kapialis]|uniref:Tagatose-6-phosphate kinase n=1 Tax=Oceanobacillus kapialis TaxID=481353 RepID=A0ABW5Q2T2_9BACI